MPRDSIDDFNDAMRRATEQQAERLVENLQSPLRISGNYDGVLSNRWESTPENTFTLTTEYSPEQVRKLFESPILIGKRYTNFCEEEDKACEVCGEPVDYEFGGHLCKRCRAAAKKYRNALTDREVELGG